jgi:hypothetical protein
MTSLALYVGMLHRAEQTLADSLTVVGVAHASEAEVFHGCQTLAKMSEEHVRLLAPIAKRYGEQTAGDEVEEPERLHAEGVAEGRTGPIGLLRDLQDLYLLASLTQTTWTVVYQASQGVRDKELMQAAEKANSTTSRQLAWLNTQLKVTAPQALVVG